MKPLHVILAVIIYKSNKIQHNKVVFIFAEFIKL